MRFPTTIAGADAADADNDLLYHAKLTEARRQKVKAAALNNHGKPDLQPGEDYTTKAKAPVIANWWPLEDNRCTAPYRNSWVLIRNNRPFDPTFLHCPMPQRGRDETEQNASLLLTYFHSFTLNLEWHSEHVPFLGQITGSVDS